MNKKSVLLAICLQLFLNLSSQELSHIDPTKQVSATKQINTDKTTDNNTFKNVKLSGYIQSEYQWGEPQAQLTIGAPNENSNKPFDRIGIRRNSIKLAYGQNIIKGMLSVNITEKGLNLKELNISIKEPFFNFIELTTGVFNRPFGYEIAYSSGLRESPERSHIIQTLFPEIRDLGAMISLQTPTSSTQNFIRLDAGILAGNGIKLETDSYKDFIAHLHADKKWKYFQAGGGISYYHGGVYQGSKKVYSMLNKGFTVDSTDSNMGKFARRQYLGFDARIVLKSLLGYTKIRAEYITGIQPSNELGHKSLNSSNLPKHDTYIRPFGGGYVIFIQSLGNLPVSLVTKYDWHDPNTMIYSNEIGINNTGIADIRTETLGFGLIWDVRKDIRLQPYFEMKHNETTNKIPKYAIDIPDNIFILRLQYQF